MRELTIFALLIALNLWVTARADDWTPITTPDAPEARYGHSMVTLPDGRVMLFGGEDGSGHLLNDMHTFDGAWNEVVPEKGPPPARRDHKAWVRNQQMYVSGGYGESNLLDDSWRYDIENNEWHQVTHSGPRPSPRYNHGVTTFGGDTYVFGGTDEYGAPLSDFWRLNADGSYTFLGDASYAFANPQLQISGDLMLVFGRPGMVAMYNFVVEQWGYFEGPPVGSGCTSARAENAQGDPVILLLGGQDGEGQESADVYEYNMATAEITEGEPMPYPIDNGGAAPLDQQQQFSMLAPGILDCRPVEDGVDVLQMVFFGGKTDGVPTDNTVLFTNVIDSVPSQLELRVDKYMRPSESGKAILYSPNGRMTGSVPYSSVIDMLNEGAAGIRIIRTEKGVSEASVPYMK